MSLRPTPFGPVPEQTARIAQAAFPAGNPYLRMRDALEALVEDRALAHLFPTRGRPAEVPRLPGGWRGARADRLEVRARAAARRCGLRSQALTS